MNYYINKILQEKTITSFLEERGIHPAKKAGDKWIYSCPVHKGDNDPSFIVYPVGTEGRNYQTYHCFGCHSGINLINLKSDLDGSLIRESVKFFLKDVNINYEDARQSIINDWKKGNLGVENNNDIETTLLLINNTCRRHIEECDRDLEEIEFFEKFFKKVDDIARAKNLDMLEEVYDILMRGKEKRIEKFKKRQEDRDISSLSWKL